MGNHFDPNGECGIGNAGSSKCGRRNLNSMRNDHSFRIADLVVSSVEGLRSSTSLGAVWLSSRRSSLSKGISDRTQKPVLSRNVQRPTLELESPIRPRMLVQAHGRTMLAVKCRVRNEQEGQERTNARRCERTRIAGRSTVSSLALALLVALDNSLPACVLNNFTSGTIRYLRPWSRTLPVAR